MGKVGTQIVQPLSIEPVKLGEIAEIFGITKERVRQLVKKGLIVKSGRGRYDVVASAQKYTAHLRDIASGKEAANTPAIQIERSRLARLQADRQQMANDLASGESLPVHVMIEFMQASCSAIRSRLRGVPSKAKRRIPKLTAKHVKILQELQDEALREMAEGGLPDSVRAALAKLGRSSSTAA